MKATSEGVAADPSAEMQQYSTTSENPAAIPHHIREVEENPAARLREPRCRGSSPRLEHRLPAGDEGSSL